MAIVPRNDEKIILKVNIHPWTYAVPILWAVLSFVACLPGISDSFKKGFKYGLNSILGMVIISGIPYFIKFIQNINKHYVLTSKRFYIEDGVFAKTKKDLPLNKINDIELRQNLIQRLFDCGDLIFLSGNDVPKKIANIEDPNTIKDQIVSAIHKNDTKIAA